MARLPRVLADDVWMTFTDLGSRAFGFGTQILLRVLFLGGGALGVAAACRRGAHPALRILLAVAGAGFLAGMIPFMYNIHYYRYQMPYVPVCLCLAVAGWWWATARAPRLRPWLAAAFAVLLVPGLVRLVEAYGRNAGNIQAQHVRLGHWIHDNLPPDAVVGINDAGALAYFGERPVVDLAGLVTNGSALPGRAGPGSLFEWLHSLPPGRRPTHFALFPAAFPYLRRTTLIGRKLVEYYLPNVSITGDTRKALYVADWSAVDWGDLPVTRRPLLDAWGFRATDTVNVADLADEERHGYRVRGNWRSTLREFNYPGDPSRLLIAGGRRIEGGERFRLACVPGEPAALVLRTEAFLPYTLEVAADGVTVGRLEVPAAPAVWSEPLFDLPAGALTSDTVEITVRLVDGDAYTAYRYWLLQ